MKRITLLIILIFIIALIANAVENDMIFGIKDSVVKDSVQLLANIAAAGGLIALFFQFKRERDLNEADFILRINQNFITNDSITKIYKLLEESKNKSQIENPFTQDDIISMANYLSYFDPFYALIKRNVVKIECIDAVLAYRFYLATNNRYMQEMLLCVENKEIAWESVYLLYDLWSEYREKNNRKIWQKSYALSETKSYNNIVKP